MWEIIRNFQVLPLIFYCTAAALKAVADTLADHFDKSIFSKLNKKFWDKTTSSKYAKFIPWTKYRLDAWHISNTLWITSFGLGVVYHKGNQYPIIELVILGAFFILTFNLFYNKLLIKQT